MSGERAPRHFGTDGIRGVANTGLLAPEAMVTLGRALGRLARAARPAGDGPGPIALAQDPRRSSPQIAGALAAGAAAEGIEVLDLGVLPTPGLAALLPGLRASLGVMVSASHNPMQDNGVKVFDGSGAKLGPAFEAWLEEEMERPHDPARPPATGAALGAIRRRPDAADTYVAYLLAHARGLDLAGMRIVVDLANGATAAVGPRLFRELGAEVVALNDAPDGVNINARCGAVHPEAMAAAVLAHRAAVGFAFDGDGDRAIAAGSDGSIQDGDRILFACARRMQADGALDSGVVVATIMSNFGLELACRDVGLRLVRTPVGDRHVVKALVEHGWPLGGEQSGHVVFGAENRFIGDGLFTALKTLAVLQAEGRPLQELTRAVAPVPQVLLNVAVREKPPLAGLPEVADRIAAAEALLSGTGRVVVRYSGTEDLLRVMVEGRDAVRVHEAAADIAAAARRAIGADARVR